MTGRPACYVEMDVLGMAPAQRVLLVYRHVLTNLRLARRAIDHGGIEERTGLREVAGRGDGPRLDRVITTLGELHEAWATIAAHDAQTAGAVA